MKDIFAAYARYNRKANAIVFELLSRLGSDELKRETKAYYPTLPQTLGHTLRSDLKWINRLSSFRPSPLPLDADAAYSTGEAIDPGSVASDLSGFAELRSRVDEAIVALVDAIPDEAFGKSFEMAWGAGRIERVLWQLLLQWFNHQTHHRGQASKLLDELGVDNDFSGMLDKIG